MYDTKDKSYQRRALRRRADRRQDPITSPDRRRLGSDREIAQRLIQDTADHVREMKDGVSLDESGTASVSDRTMITAAVLGGIGKLSIKSKGHVETILQRILVQSAFWAFAGEKKDMSLKTASSDESGLTAERIDKIVSDIPVLPGSFVQPYRVVMEEPYMQSVTTPLFPAEEAAL